MTAATQDRSTPQRGACRRSGGMAANKLAYAGTIAVLNASGYVEPGTTATGLIALGKFRSQYNNVGGANGAIEAEFDRGIFRFNNSTSGDEITNLDIGSVCYIVDDQTVAKTDGAGTRSAAGKVDDVDASGVWVRIDPTN